MVHAATPPVVTFYHDIEQDLDSDADRQKCRDVVRDFLAIENRHGVHATYNVVGKLFSEQPDLITCITAAGHEVAFHSYDHRRDWNASDSAVQVDACRAISGSVLGYRSPRSEIDDAGVRRLWERGFLWNAESDKRQEPYFVFKGLVRLPVTTDDWPLYRQEVGVERYADDFTALLRTRRYVSVGFHDTVASLDPEARLRLWDRLLQAARDAHATILTCSEAADLYRRAVVADYYTRTAQEWNAQTRVLYRTRRLREIVKAEAARLGTPVIADLGSGGGVLSSAAADVARTISCVDTSAGMGADAERAGLTARLGEATDSGLQEHSIDLVICARIVEYLFWPEQLAHEIRRIGRPGASFIVTFPARGEVPPANEGAPPDRIRRYFSADEIVAWAQPLGPGRLIPLQYDAGEPTDAEAEQQYRALEAMAPSNRVPTNWVYIGTLGDGDALSSKAVVPLSAAPFRFDGEVPRFPDVLRRIARGLKRRLG